MCSLNLIPIKNLHSVVNGLPPLKQFVSSGIANAVYPRFNIYTSSFVTLAL